VGKNISDGIRINNFDEVKVWLNAVVETVEIQKINWLLIIVLQFCYLAAA